LGHRVRSDRPAGAGGDRCRQQVIGAALSPGLAGVYQVAIQPPLVRAKIGGFDSPDNVYLFVAR